MTKRLLFDFDYAGVRLEYYLPASPVGSSWGEFPINRAQQCRSRLRLCTEYYPEREPPVAGTTLSLSKERVCMGNRSLFGSYTSPSLSQRLRRASVAVKKHQNSTTGHWKRIVRVVAIETCKPHARPLRHHAHQVRRTAVPNLWLNTTRYAISR